MVAVFARALWVVGEFDGDCAVDGLLVEYTCDASGLAAELGKVFPSAVGLPSES